VRFRIVVVGKPRNRALAEAIADYEERAARYWPIEVREVKEEPAKGFDPAVVQQREWARLHEAAGASAAVVLCDEAGRSLDSPAFAAWLDAKREAARDVALVIGGAVGFPSAAREVASDRISLAPWTLPHELARLVLAEQLYRAGTIVRGEPYHK
jgi:23S rRNA (pseudouridine1915-N3)-methyltransferase